MGRAFVLLGGAFSLRDGRLGGILVRTTLITVITLGEYTGGDRQ
jgi:hypothetical protein